MTDCVEWKHSEQVRKSKLKIGYQQQIAEFGMTHVLTFNFAERVDPSHARYKMKGFCGRIEREALGRRYYLKGEPRLAVLGFAEHLNTNPHWHCVVRAEGLVYHAIQVCSRPIWEKLAPGANIHFSRPRSLPAIQKYLLKDFHKDDASEHVFEYAADRNKPFRRPNVNPVK